MATNSTYLTRVSVLAAVCIALNIGLNKVAVVLALPVFLDCIGTILAAALVPPIFAVLVGVVSNLIGGVVTHPAIPFYIGTQAIIALMAVFAFRKGWFDHLVSAILVGLAIGVVSAIVSAPITVVMFGGVTDGATALNAILLAAGKDIWTAVLSGSLIISSIDKVIAAVVVWLLLQRLPERMKVAETR